MALCGALAILCAGLIAGRARATRTRVVATLAAIAVFPLLLGSVVLTRFDLWPVALVLAALAALLWERHRLGFGILGLAVAAKLFPAVLVPLALSYVWQRRGRREALVCLGVLGGVVALVFLPFVVLGAGRRRLQPRPPARAAAADREPRLGVLPRRAPPVRARASRCARATARRTSTGPGPAVARDAAQRSSSSGCSSGSGSAGPATGDGARPLERRSAGRVRRAREGALAAVPDLARRRSSRSSPGRRGLCGVAAARGRARADAALVPVALLGARARVRSPAARRSCSRAT